MANLEFNNPDSTFKIPTTEERYADVLAAIQTILVTGQSYTIIGGRQFTFAALDSLRSLEAELENKLLAERGDTGIYHADTGGLKEDDES